ncbi:MAG: hypothetical protein BM564_06580 [Bacteroidetes bacterium MedPE-SWsnd-G2]|nr:MAG: hypothetical protein BM564_06580 [Bacteroidetes bacterium MedPE-SWsnd-G2]
MKYIIILIFIACFTSIFCGYFLDVDYSEKLIGFGVAGIFLIAFPLFSYYRWKNKDVKDYMLSKENLDKMKSHQKDA